MRSRTATALAGLLVSLAVSVAAWYYLDTLLVFLFLPFVPFLFRGRAGRDRRDRGRTTVRNQTTTRKRATARESRPVKACPDCGFRTRNPEFSHCPRDGTRLEPDGSD